MTPGHGYDIKLILDDWCGKWGHDVMMTPQGLMCYRHDRADPSIVWTGPCWVKPNQRRRGVMSFIVKEIACMPGVLRLRSRTSKDNEGITKMYQKLGRAHPVENEDGTLYWDDDVRRLRQGWGL